MNNFFKSISLFILVAFVASCSKSDSSSEPLRDFDEQRIADMANIEGFLQTHYMEVVNNPGGTTDMNVSFGKITAGVTQPSIWDQTAYPLQSYEITVKQNDEDITYKIYYIKLRQGSGPNSKAPCNVDRVLTSYRGEYIYNGSEGIISKQFEELLNPQSYFNLTSVIRGWSEIFPQFKTGSYSSNPDGTVSYYDFGAGVMFIPSGLAYYSAAQSGIPSYSPLIFSFKLYEIQRTDLDNDGIDSYLEDINGDGYLRDNDTTYEDDTDHDGTPDYLDADDDGDSYTTRSEITNPLTNQPFAFDDIPLCGDGKKRHLSAACHAPSN